MTSQEPITPHFVDRDIPDTEVFVVSSPAPVFVDSTGRRRRVLRRLAYVFGGLCMVYGGLVSVSLAGGPVSSSAVLPLPDLRGNDDAAADAKPTPIPAPSPSAAPQSRFITESLRRPVSVVRDERLHAGHVVRPLHRVAAGDEVGRADRLSAGIAQLEGGDVGAVGHVDRAFEGANQAKLRHGRA